MNTSLFPTAEAPVKSDKPAPVATPSHDIDTRTIKTLPTDVGEAFFLPEEEEYFSFEI